MTKHRSIYRTILMSALVTCTGIRDTVAAIPPAYHVTDLGALNGVQSAGVAINSSGQVTGYSTVTGSLYQHAFVWTPTTPNGTSGAMSDLGTIGGNDSYGWDINAIGQVTGFSEGVAFLWSPTTPNGASGSMVPLGTPDDRFVSGQGINDSGQVAGSAYPPAATSVDAFLWTPTTPNGTSGALHDLGTVGGQYSYGSGINAGGQVVGQSGTSDGFLRAFLWTPTAPNGASGSMIDLGTMGGTNYSAAWDISDAGQVIGEANTTGDVATHAFLYDGTMHDLGTLGGNSSGAFGINAGGLVTGYSQMPGNRSEHAFLWTSSGGIVDLNTLIHPSTWELRIARGINDAGQITGYGQIDGQDHAYLLTPITVPEPFTFALVALGAVALTIRRNRRNTNLLCLFCVLSVTAAAHAAQYTVTDLGTLGGSYSAGFGISNNGQVTGLSRAADNGEYAFLYDSAMHNLGTLGGSLSVGQGVNDAGQVTGYSQIDGDSEFHAFLYDGAMHDLGTLGETSSIGSDVNNNGQVTGYSVISGGLYYETRAFIWTDGGGMQDLGLLGGAASYGFGINDLGHVTGGSETTEGEFHAILYDGTMHDLGTLGGTLSHGFAISENGLVTGSSWTTEFGEDHAFLWTPTSPNGASGSMIDLGTLGGNISSGADANSNGQVVGRSSLNPYDYGYHAFLYTSGSGIVDLNSLINPHSGWELFSATGINDAGQITGDGRIGNQYRGYVLTPIVPEPATLALAALGAVALAVRRNRRTTNLLCLCCALLATSAARAAPYIVTDLGVTGAENTLGWGINASGQVTGYAGTPGEETTTGFVWKPTTPNSPTGTLYRLDTLGGYFSWGIGINAGGQIAGLSSTTDDEAEHATLWIPTTPNGTTGTLYDLGTLGGTYSQGTGINDNGLLTGYADLTDDEESHAIIWKPTTPGSASGTMHDLGTLGGTYSFGWDINASGHVAGEADLAGDAVRHAFLWKPTTPNGTIGAIHDLGTLGGSLSFAEGINDCGQVTGSSRTTDDEAVNAFLWTPTTPGGITGAMLDLGSLGDNGSYGYAVSSSGRVVGSSVVPFEVSNYSHAFLYTRSAGMVDLNTLIDPLSGWELLDADDINDAGQITGQGIINDKYHAYLLTPASLISGDYDGSGVVGPEDYDLWKANFGSTTMLAADGNGNFIVDAADYTVWRDNLGNSLGAGGGSALPSAEPLSAAVPEPSSWMLLCLGFVAVAVRRAGSIRPGPRRHSVERLVKGASKPRPF